MSEIEQLKAQLAQVRTERDFEQKRAMYWQEQHELQRQLVVEQATKLDAALAKCAEKQAELREVTERLENEWESELRNHSDNKPFRVVTNRAITALSTDCGQGWHSPQEWDALQANLASEKKWSEELAADLCQMEDALGFKQDQTDKHGAFVPTKVPWLERVRDLIAKEGELGDLQAKCEQMRQALHKVKKWFIHNTDIVEENPLLDDVVLPALSDSPAPPVVPASELEPTLKLLRFLLPEIVEDGEDKMIKVEIDRLTALHEKGATK